VRALVASAAFIASALASHRAHALDPFEIQVYDGTANETWVPSVELHANRVFSGLTTATPPLLAQNQQTHFTLEGALGIGRGFELGLYLQSAVRADGTFDYAGTKLRLKWVTTDWFHPNWRLGANVELALLPEQYDVDRWSAELRPIAAWENQRWVFAINPIIGIPLAGQSFKEGPTFEPAAMAKVKIAGRIALGLEYYGSIGPIAHPSDGSAQEHYLFEAFDLLDVGNLELNVGVGEGLTRGSNALVGKMIVGWTFESKPAERHARNRSLRTSRWLR